MVKKNNSKISDHCGRFYKRGGKAVLISILQNIGAVLILVFMITNIVGLNMLDISPFSDRFAWENLSSTQILGKKIVIASWIIFILSVGLVIIPTQF